MLAVYAKLYTVPIFIYCYGKVWHLVLILLQKINVFMHDRRKSL